MSKRDVKYPDPAATTRAASTVQKQILAAARKSAAAETEIADVMRDFTGNPSTPREQKDFQELKALLRSLDGPEYLLRTQGYSRAIFPPDQSTKADPFE
jgi:hypothetical protein